MICYFKSITVMIVVAVILSGCSNDTTDTIKHSYLFKGEGDTWSAEYMVEATEKFIKKNNKTGYKSESSDEFTLRFKGEPNELKSIRTLSYRYEGNAGSGGSEGITSPLTESKLIKKGSSTGTFERKDSIIKVEVEWDGKHESFELKNIK